MKAWHQLIANGRTPEAKALRSALA